MSERESTYTPGRFAAMGRIQDAPEILGLLARAFEQVAEENRELLAEVERVRDQERRATIKYLEQQADLARAFKPDVARVLQATAYEIEAGFHAMIIVGDA